MLYSARSLKYTVVTITAGLVGSAVLEPGDPFATHRFGGNICTLTMPVEAETLDPLERDLRGDETVEIEADMERTVERIPDPPVGPATNLDERPELRDLLELKPGR